MQVSAVASDPIGPAKVASGMAAKFVYNVVSGTGVRFMAFLDGLLGAVRGGGPWESKGDGSDPQGWKHKPEDKRELATFGAGCYWGTEKFFATAFAEKYPGAILGTAVGFMNPDANAKANPSYEQVCYGGKTGFVEVAHVLFDSSKVDYEELVKFFYSFHDPTTKNRQGNDSGTQYASVIFTHSPEQKAKATKVSDQVAQMIRSGKIRCYVQGNVVTSIYDANPFYNAREDHQRYLERNPMGYCNHVRYFNWDDMEASENLNKEVHSLISDNKVMVFSKSYCPYCTETKQALTKLGVDYKVIELD